MENFSTSPNFTLEMFGIALALLSFSGADKSVEQALSSARIWVRHSAPFFQAMALIARPSWDNLLRQWKLALRHAAIALIAVLPLVAFDAGAQERLAWVSAMGAPWEIWKIATVLLLSPIALILIWSIGNTVIGLSLYVTLSCIWRLFWLLSRPPAGVLGTIGLLIALAGPVSRWGAA